MLIPVTLPFSDFEIDIEVEWEGYVAGWEPLRIRHILPDKTYIFPCPSGSLLNSMAVEIILNNKDYKWHESATYFIEETCTEYIRKHGKGGL